MATAEATINRGDTTFRQQAEHGDGTWVTIPELTRITGKKATALRMWIKRKWLGGEHELIRKIQEKHGEMWVVHPSLIKQLSRHVESEVMPEQAACSPLDMPRVEPHPCSVNRTEHAADLISFRAYLEERREWQEERDSLRHGLMMYRYKFEELDRQVRLLPAPPEMLSTRLSEVEQDRRQKAEALEQAEKIVDEAKKAQKLSMEVMTKLRAKLVEEVKAKEAYRDQWELAHARLNRPWWKKLLGLK